MGSLLFTLAFILSSSTHAADPTSLERLATERTLWNHPQWQNLVHYKKGIFGALKSQVDGDSFFLSADGKTNPRSELIATLRGFFRTPSAQELSPPKQLTDAETQAIFKQAIDSHDAKKISVEERDRILSEERAKALTQLREHPICAFPARLRFLKRELGWGGEGLPKITCHRQNEFRRRLDAKSVSLVFSSFFLNNPSSAYGHSFIRINSGLWSQYGNHRNELLDTGINYAANVTTANPLMYAIFGMVGLMPGTFTSVPYYYKVREYNDFESRDLWSYDLNLTPDEVEMLVDHIWEEGSTYYYYKYFNENCSYHMFTLLDAAAPRYQLADRLPFYVIPSDTIRVLAKVPGIVTHISYRPSVRSQFLYRLKQLGPDEKRALDSLVESRNPEKIDPGLEKDSQARVLDAYSDQIELISANELLENDSDAQKLKQRVLIKRASLGVTSANLEVPAPDREAPHLGHGMRRFSLGYAVEKDRGPATTLGYRFAMHEMLDPGKGYPRNMQIDFAQVKFRYLPRPEGFRNQFEFDEVNLFKLTALTPLSRYYSAKSLYAELGAKRAFDRDCENGDLRCFPFAFDFGKGWSIDPAKNGSTTLFAFLNGRLSYSPNYYGFNFRFAAGPRIGGLVYFSDDLRFLTFGEVLGRPWAKNKMTYAAEADLRWGLTEGWALDLSARHERDLSEVGSQLMFYF